MKIKEFKRNENTISLTIEITDEEIKCHYIPAFKKISKNKIVPGFRKGKANYETFIKHYGEAAILQEASIIAVNQAYLDALDEKKLQVVDNPQDINIEDYQKGKPLTFSCKVDVKPLIKLGKYKGLKAKKELKKVEQKDIESEISKLQENAASYNNVERKTKENDLLIFDIQTIHNKEEYKPWTQKGFTIQLGNSNFGKEFEDNLLDQEKNKEISFSTSYPKDHSNTSIADKTFDFKITITEIKEKSLPELTDEFIAENSQFKSLKELSAKIEENLEKSYQQESESKLKEDLIKSITENIEIQIPEGLIKQESKVEFQQYANMIRQSGLTIDKYLQLTGKTQDDLLNDMRPTIEKRVKNELVLEQVAFEEKIEVSTDEQISEIRKSNPKINSDEEAQKLLQQLDINRLNYHIKQQKAVQFLIDNAKIA